MLSTYFSSFRGLLSRVDTNLRGLSERKKIIIFESDDWGSIRMPSLQARDRLINSGIDLREEIFSFYDGLEKDSDIDDLANVLIQHKDALGSYPKLTLNFVVSNPNFESIRNNDFQVYKREPISNTYQAYTDSSKVLSKIREGIEQNIFMPQFHGTEHVNVPLWISLLQKGNSHFMKAFDMKCYGLNRSSIPSRAHIQATYDVCDESYVMSSIKIGLDLFERLFGFRSATFIPNNYVWNPVFNERLKENGVLGLQGMKYTLLPKCVISNSKGRIRNFNGFIGDTRQFVRNVEFEQTSKNYNLNRTIDSIGLAFKMSKPAIISTHRLNYTSRIEKNIKQHGLSEMDRLLKKILQKWPDVRFMSTHEYLEYLGILF